MAGGPNRTPPRTRTSTPSSPTRNPRAKPPATAALPDGAAVSKQPSKAKDQFLPGSGTSKQAPAFQLTLRLPEIENPVPISQEQAIEILHQALRPFFGNIQWKFEDLKWTNWATPRAKMQRPYFRVLEQVGATLNAPVPAGKLSKEYRQILGQAILFAEQFLPFLPKKSTAQSILSAVLPPLKKRFPSAALPSTFLYGDVGWKPPSARRFQFDLSFLKPAPAAIADEPSLPPAAELAAPTPTLSGETSMSLPEARELRSVLGSSEQWLGRLTSPEVVLPPAPAIESDVATKTSLTTSPTAATLDTAIAPAQKEHTITQTDFPQLFQAQPDEILQFESANQWLSQSGSRFHSMACDFDGTGQIPLKKLVDYFNFAIPFLAAMPRNAAKSKLLQILRSWLGTKKFEEDIVEAFNMVWAEDEEASTAASLVLGETQAASLQTQNVDSATDKVTPQDPPSAEPPALDAVTAASTIEPPAALEPPNSANSPQAPEVDLSTSLPIFFTVMKQLRFYTCSDLKMHDEIIGLARRLNEFYETPTVPAALLVEILTLLADRFSAIPNNQSKLAFVDWAEVALRDSTLPIPEELKGRLATCVEIARDRQQEHGDKAFVENLPERVDLSPYFVDLLRKQVHRLLEKHSGAASLERVKIEALKSKTKYPALRWTLGALAEFYREIPDDVHRRQLTVELKKLLARHDFDEDLRTLFKAVLPNPILQEPQVDTSVYNEPFLGCLWQLRVPHTFDLESYDAVGGYLNYWRDSEHGQRVPRSVFLDVLGFLAENFASIPPKKSKLQLVNVVDAMFNNPISFPVLDFPDELREKLVAAVETARQRQVEMKVQAFPEDLPVKIFVGRAAPLLIRHVERLLAAHPQDPKLRRVKIEAIQSKILYHDFLRLFRVFAEFDSEIPEGEDKEKLTAMFEILISQYDFATYLPADIAAFWLKADSKTSGTHVPRYRSVLFSALKQLSNASALQLHLHDAVFQRLQDLTPIPAQQPIPVHLFLDILTLLADHFDQMLNVQAKLELANLAEDILEDTTAVPALPDDLRAKLRLAVEAVRVREEEHGAAAFSRDLPNIIIFSEYQAGLLRRHAEDLLSRHPDAVFLQRIQAQGIEARTPYRHVLQLLATFAEFYPEIPEGGNKDELTNLLKSLLEEQNFGDEIPERLAAHWTKASPPAAPAQEEEASGAYAHHYRSVLFSVLSQLSSTSARELDLHDAVFEQLKKLPFASKDQPLAGALFLEILTFLADHFQKIPDKRAKLIFANLIRGILEDDSAVPTLPDELRTKLDAAAKEAHMRERVVGMPQAFPDNLPKVIVLPKYAVGLLRRCTKYLLEKYPDAASLERIKVEDIERETHYRHALRLLGAFLQFYPEIPKGTDKDHLAITIDHLLKHYDFGLELTRRLRVHCPEIVPAEESPRKRRGKLPEPLERTVKIPAPEIQAIARYHEFLKISTDASFTLSAAQLEGLATFQTRFEADPKRVPEALLKAYLDLLADFHKQVPEGLEKTVITATIRTWLTQYSGLVFSYKVEACFFTSRGPRPADYPKAKTLVEDKDPMSQNYSLRFNSTPATAKLANLELTLHDLRVLTALQEPDVRDIVQLDGDRKQLGFELYQLRNFAEPDREAAVIVLTHEEDFFAKLYLGLMNQFQKSTKEKTIQAAQAVTLAAKLRKLGKDSAFAKANPRYGFSFPQRAPAQGPRQTPSEIVTALNQMVLGQEFENLNEVEVRELLAIRAEDMNGVAKAEAVRYQGNEVQGPLSKKFREQHPHQECKFVMKNDAQGRQYIIMLAFHAAEESANSAEPAA